MRKRNCSLITVVTKGQYHFEFSKSLSESNIAFTQCKKVSDNFPFTARPLNDKAEHFDTSIFTCFTSLPQFTTRKKCFPTKTQTRHKYKTDQRFWLFFFFTPLFETLNERGISFIDLNYQLQDPLWEKTEPRDEAILHNDKS